MTQSSASLSGWLARDLQTLCFYGVRYQTGLTATDDSIVLLCEALALISTSWISGFVLGSLSRRTLWVNAALFYLTWFFPVALFSISALVVRHDSISIVWLPSTVLLSACFFVLPSGWGMRQGLRRPSLSLRRTILFSITVLTMNALALWTGSWWHDTLITWSQGTWHGPAYDWQKPALIRAVTNWPLFYLLTISPHRRTLSSAQ